MNRVKIALPVLAVAVVGVLAWQVVKPSGEPRYQGRSLTHWIRSYRRDPSGVQLIASPEERATADNAVRHIGTNAFPYLLKWLAYDPNPRLRRIQAISCYVPTPIWRTEYVRNHILEDPGLIRREWTVSALMVLDQQVKPVVPELIRTANSTNGDFLMIFTMLLLHSVWEKTLIFLTCGGEQAGSRRERRLCSLFLSTPAGFEPASEV